MRKMERGEGTSYLCCEFLEFIGEMGSRCEYGGAVVFFVQDVDYFSAGLAVFSEEVCDGFSACCSVGYFEFAGGLFGVMFAVLLRCEVGEVG